MRLLLLLAWAWFGLAAAGQTPTEYATFLSDGKAISCAIYAPRETMATIVFLRGATPSDPALARLEAHFFADHGFKVLLPDYLSVTPSTDATPANYRRWAQAVEDIVSELHGGKIALAGRGLGGAVALLAGSHKIGVGAIAEWSGLLPNEFFSQVQIMPPLLILHGDQDKQVPVVNARQLVRLCKLKDFTCEAEIYPGEGHTFSSRALDSANQRALTFFRTYVR